MVRMSTSRRFLSAVADVYRPEADTYLATSLQLAKLALHTRADIVQKFRPLLWIVC